MWMYQGKELKDEDIPAKAIGFIYLITHLPSGKKYLGKKLTTMAATKTVKGVKKKIRKDSNWKDYYSSSPVLQEMVETEGKDKFKREILVFCSSKGMLLYSEELSLYMVGALESDDWINMNIRSKVYSNWVKKDEAILLRKSLIPHSSSSSSNSLISSGAISAEQNAQNVTGSDPL